MGQFINTMNTRVNGKSSTVAGPTRHQCLIYAGPPSQQLPALAATIQGKINEGYRCLYMNSRPMVAGIRTCLAAIGVDVVSEIARARLVLSSEPVTTADGGWDIDSMLAKLDDAVEQALSDGYQGLFATGDMTWEFGSEKNFPKLMEYEHRLEELFRKRKALHGICQYHQDTLPPEVIRQGFLTHRTLYINETLSRVNPHYAAPGRAIEVNPKLDEMITALR